MMREILFRGKRTMDGEWIEGGYFLEPYPNKAFMTQWNSFGMGFIEHIEVDPFTVGQYTGLKDKNGKNVFEGDIVRDNATGNAMFCNKDNHRLAVVKFGLHEVMSDDPYCWGEAYGFFFEGNTFYKTPAQYRPYCESSDCDFEVIGNIHDNPDLLK